MGSLLREHGADPAAVTGDDRALGMFLSGGSNSPVATGGIDEMLIIAVQAGDLEAVRRLLDAGARVDGDPGSGEDPLGEAAWRGRAAIVRELVARGATLTFPRGGSAIGAAFHGSRHCHDPEGGPTMRTVDEVPASRYAEVVKILLAAGAPVPAKLWDGAPSAATFISELGLEVPAGLRGSDAWMCSPT